MNVPGHPGYSHVPGQNQHFVTRLKLPSYDTTSLYYYPEQQRGRQSEDATARLRQEPYLQLTKGILPSLTDGKKDKRLPDGGHSNAQESIKLTRHLGNSYGGFSPHPEGLFWASPRAARERVNVGLYLAVQPFRGQGYPHSQQGATIGPTSQTAVCKHLRMLLSRISFRPRTRRVDLFRTGTHLALYYREKSLGGPDEELQAQISLMRLNLLQRVTDHREAPLLS